MCSCDMKAVVWDLDNTLYRFTSDLKYNCNVAAAKASIDLGLQLSFDEALQIAIKSENTYNYSLHEYTLSHGLTYQDLHHPFHQNIEVQHADPIDGLDQKLENLQIPQAVLTNASRSWAGRVIKYLNLDHVLKGEMIFCMEDFGYEPKARSNKGLSLALDKLGCDATDTIIIDDLSRNLLKAKELGLQTALTHYDEYASEDHIDYYFKSTNDFFDHI